MASTDIPLTTSDYVLVSCQEHQLFIFIKIKNEVFRQMERSMTINLTLNTVFKCLLGLLGLLGAEQLKVVLSSLAFLICQAN